jgi:hypothetical protein
MTTPLTYIITVIRTADMRRSAHAARPFGLARGRCRREGVPPANSADGAARTPLRGGLGHGSGAVVPTKLALVALLLVAHHTHRPDNRRRR